MNKKDLKKIDDHLVHAIEWASAEYNYLEEFKEEISHLKSTSKNHNLRKAAHFLRYIGKAERRAFKFEGEVGKSLSKILVELVKQANYDSDLKYFILGLREVMRQMGIERAQLAKYASWHVGVLDKDFEHLKDEGEEGGKKYQELVNQVAEDIGEMEKWIGAIEASMKKAQKLKEKIELSSPYRYLRRIGWRINEDDPATQVLINHFSDIRGKNIFNNLEMIYYQSFVSLLYWFYELKLITENNWKIIIVFINKAIEARDGFLGNDVNLIKRAGYIFTQFPTSLFKYLRNEGLSFNDNLEIHLIVIKSGIFSIYYFTEVTLKLSMRDILVFFKYSIIFLNLIKNEDIDLIYGIDRSGRIISVLCYTVLRKLKLSRKIKLYFINAMTTDTYSYGRKFRGTQDREKKVVLYSEKQRKELVGKNVLLMDDTFHTGKTMYYVREYLEKIVGPSGKVVVTIPWRNDKGSLNQYHSIKFGEPNFMTSRINYGLHWSGLMETKNGNVIVDANPSERFKRDIKNNTLLKGVKSPKDFSIQVRKSFSGLAEAIAFFLKKKGY